MCLSCEKLDLPDTNGGGVGDSSSPPATDTPIDTTIMGVPVYTVLQALSLPTGSHVCVDGYIWGYVDGTSYSKATFSAPTNSANTNLLIGDADAWMKPQFCMPVRLKSNSDEDWRAIFNLYENPDLIGRKVRLRGIVIDYFKRKGLDKLMFYEWIDEGEGNTNPPNDSQPGENPPSDDKDLEYPTINDSTDEVVSGRVKRKTL